MNISLATFLIFLIDEIACKSIPNRAKQQNGDPQKSVEAYDQRQSGKYNIHINVKDVQLIKLDDFKIGDDYSYGDYGDYGSDADYDYDVSNLTTSPVWAHLGTDKPTTSTKKPKPTMAPSKPTKPVIVASTENSEKITSSTSSAVISETSSIETPTANRFEENSSSSLISNESEDFKPALNDKPDSTTKEPVATTTTTIKSTTVSQTQEPIDYEEIPVQVIYERRKHNNYGNQQKKGGGRKRINRRPSVQVFEPHTLKHHKNVEIIDPIEPKLIDDDDYVMNICGHNEYLDNLGRCRTRRNQNKQGQ